LKKGPLITTYASFSEGGDYFLSFFQPGFGFFDYVVERGIKAVTV
jgi:hypothetical protein